MLLVGLVSSLFFVPVQAFALQPLVVPAPIVATTTATSTLVIPPILKEIGRCESGNRQYNDDGTVVRGIVNPKDIGRWQINWDYHAAKAKELGLDLFSEEGNTKYALYLFEHEGTSPWNSSKDCWGVVK